MSDLTTALTELRAAQPAYRKAWEQYDGEAPEKFSSVMMARLFGASDADFKVNFACRPVDAVLDRLEIAAITAEDESANEQLAALWEANEMDIEAPEIHEKALAFGDGYLFVWESNPDAAEDDEPSGEATPVESPIAGVDMFFNSPESVRVFYEEENPRKISYAVKTWCVMVAEKELIRTNLYYADYIQKLISKEGTKGEKDTDFEPFTDDTTDKNGIVDNPYGRVPFFHFRTKRPYGRPEHKNAFGPQNAITKISNNQMATNDFAALPQRYGLLETGQSTDDDIDWGEEDSTDPDEKQSALVSKPGSLWALRHYKSVGQFEPADPKNFLDPLSFYVRAMAATTSTPSRWFDPTGDAPSGESLRADDAPLVKKIEARRRAFGATWSDALGFALKILGYDTTVTVQWAPAQTVDDLEGWQATIAQQDAGVPIRQTLLERGYTIAQCDAWGFTETQPNGPDLIDIADDPDRARDEVLA